MCAAQGQTVARQVVHTLEDLKSEENFALFWRKVKVDASNKDIEEPQLPRRRKKRQSSGSSLTYHLRETQKQLRNFTRNTTLMP